MEASTEYHVASYVAQLSPGQHELASDAIAKISGAEIHALSAEGKLVFTLEGPSQTSLGKIADDIKYYPGVLTLAPVYHQYLSDDTKG